MQFTTYMPTSGPSSMGAGDGWIGWNRNGWNWWNGGWNGGTADGTGGTVNGTGGTVGGLGGGPSASGPCTPGAGPPRGAGPVAEKMKDSLKRYSQILNLLGMSGVRD